MSEDPDKKILEWCGHLAVPRLVDEKAYAACKGCQTKIGGFLTKNTTHHWSDDTHYQWKAAGDAHMII
jgi:hypothetical protein